MGKDTVPSIVDLVRAAAPGLTEAQLGAIAAKLYADLGGSRPYIPKAPAAGKAWRLGEQLAAGMPLAQAFETVGVSESYGYKLISRSWRFR